VLALGSPSTRSNGRAERPPTTRQRWSAGRRSGSVARPRKPSDHRPRAPRDGSRTPVRTGDSQNPVQARCDGVRRKCRAPSGRRSAAPLAPPGAPFPSGKRKKGPAMPAPETTKQGGGALAKPLLVIPGRARREPKSITSSSQVETLAERHREDHGYGFRARHFVAPRNDGRGFPLDESQELEGAVTVYPLDIRTRIFLMSPGRSPREP
jgi:hypothetical protein